jgi:NAD(P)-dependent dehydrogenase (short-subunit alcohol dehydrogenase family)
MNKKVWLLTGAGRGMGADIVRAAFAAATRWSQRPKQRRGVQGMGTVERPADRRTGCHEPQRCRSSGACCCRRFGRIDLLVNNAASFYAGSFEELTPEQFERQLSVSLLGPMNVTRAVLPVMRKQRAGHIISISSSAGLAAGFDFVSAYAASKFGLEGWMESLQAEVAPFGITTTVVNPGFFRTELLTEQSTNYADPSIADYDERRGPLVEYWKSQNGQQSPAIRRSSREHAGQRTPPSRFIAGADAIADRRAEDCRSEGADRGASGSLGRHSLSTEPRSDAHLIFRSTTYAGGSSILRFGWACKLLIGSALGGGSRRWTISATGSSVKPHNLACFADSEFAGRDCGGQLGRARCDRSQGEL